MIEKINLLASDQTDKNGEKIALSTLEHLMNETNLIIKSSYTNHDYRFPPVGRISHAFIKNEEETYNLYGKFEFFEMDDLHKENKIEGKKLAINRLEKPMIICDKSYELTGLAEEVHDLQKLLCVEEIEKEVQTSLYHVSTLAIGFGIFKAKSFFDGFILTISDDFWSKLQEIVRKNSKVYDNAQYIFSIVLENDRFATEVMINFTNPQDTDLEKILISSRHKIEAVLNAYYEESINVAKIVFNVIDSETLEHEYSLFEDGTPFHINNLERYEEVLNEIKSEIEEIK